jgi:hypothetical protein
MHVVEEKPSDLSNEIGNYEQIRGAFFKCINKGKTKIPPLSFPHLSFSCTSRFGHHEPIFGY